MRSLPVRSQSAFILFYVMSKRAGRASMKEPKPVQKKQRRLHYYVEDVLELNTRLSDLTYVPTDEDNEALDQALRVIEWMVRGCKRTHPLPEGCDALFRSEGCFHGQMDLMNAVFHLCYMRELRALKSKDQ